MSDSHIKTDDLDVDVESIVRRANLIGCAVGVVRGGRLTYTRGFGVADLKTSRPVNQDTAFRIGSITKTFTGIGIMQLRERGLVDLDEPITRYLRQLAWDTRSGFRPPTLREVMTHVAGVGEVLSWGDLRKPVMGLAVKRGTSVPAMTETFPKGIRPEVGPGQKWAYSNHAVAALGQVVEDVSGQPFSEYMSEHLFAPLGMTATELVAGERIGPLATGYLRMLGRPVKVPWYDVAVPPAGAAISSLADMAKFAAALMQSGRAGMSAVLSPESVEEMFRCHWAPDPRLPTQGLIFFLDDFQGHRIVWHDGGVPGFVSSMLVAPDDDLAVIVLSNSMSQAPHGIAETVLRDALGCAPLLDSLVPHDTTPVAADLQARVTGRYGPTPGLKTNFRHIALFGNELSVRAHGNKLVVRGLRGPLARGVALHPCSTADPYAFEGVTVSPKTHLPTRVRLVFVPDASGTVAAVAGNLVLPFRFLRKPSWHSLRVLVPIALTLVTAAALATLILT